MAISIRRDSAASPALATAASPADRATRIAIPLFFAGAVLATTLVVNISGLTISADRLVLLAFFIPMVSALGQVRDLRLQAFDFCIFATIAWLVLSLVVNNGAERGVKY